MATRGKLAVDIQFTDSTTSAVGVNSMKTLAMQQSSEYTTGKVAIVSGTAGTATVSVPVAPTTYKDSSGDAVSLSGVSWFSFRSSALASCTEVAGEGKCVSDDEMVTISVATGGTAGFSIAADTGTASYTLAIYGT